MWHAILPPPKGTTAIQGPTWCISSHPVNKLYDIGLLEPLLPTGFNAHSLLPGVDWVDILFNSAYHARKCAEGMHPRQWFTIKSQVPFIWSPSLSWNHHHNGKDGPLEWMGTPCLQATSQGQFFSIRHVLCTIMVLLYGSPKDSRANLPLIIPLCIPHIVCACHHLFVF